MPTRMGHEAELDRARAEVGDRLREALAREPGMAPEALARLACEGLLARVTTDGLDARDVIDVVDPVCHPQTRPGLGLRMPGWDTFGECDWPRDVRPRCHTEVADPDEPGALLAHCPGCGARVEAPQDDATGD